MAVNQVPKSKTLSIEFQSDLDKAGDPIFSKKSFSGVKIAAADQDVLDIAESIKKVLEPNTRSTFINQVNTLVQS